MITVFSQTVGKRIPVDGVVNIGGWFGKRWLLGVGCGFSTAFFLVEAEDGGCAIDEFVDSNHGHWIKVPQEEVNEKEAKLKVLFDKFSEEEAEKMIATDSDLKAFYEVERAGNFGEPVDLTKLRVLEEAQQVNFFDSKESLE